MNKRRRFLKTALIGGMAPVLFSNSKAREEETPEMLRPKQLKKGDTLGLIAPASGAWENEDIHIAAETVASLGFRVKEGKSLYDRKGYLAGTDQDRADDLNRMFADQSVHGVIALRGGYGSPRILPYLDYELIRANPKALIGYSDITALLHAIFTKSGLIAFHGPIASQSFTPYTLAAFKKILMTPSAPISLGEPPPFEATEGVVERENRLVKIVPGKARGRLMGGNLSLMVKMLGTPYEPDFRDKILVIEDVGEKPYRIDGMLTHLWLSGKLKQVAGIALGKFTDCEPDGPMSLSLETIFKERFQELRVPTLRGLMFGHIRDQATFPVGALAELNVDAGTLTLLETAVA